MHHEDSKKNAESQVQKPGARQSVLEVALHYAEMGYPVLPLVPGGKEPHPAAGPHGYKAASTNPHIITAWFKTRPDANLGVVIPPGVVVFDFDNQKDLEALLNRHPSLRKTSWSVTPRGGHIWATVPEGVRLRSRSTQYLPQFEIKRPGSGYLVEYPSQTPGGVYTWRVPLRPPGELKRVPEILLSALTIKTKPLVIVNQDATRLFERILSKFDEAAHLGNRHNALVTALAALYLNNAPQEYISRVLQLALERGLPHFEVEGIDEWGRQRLTKKGVEDD